MYDRLKLMAPSIEILFYKGMAMLLSFYSIKLLANILNSDGMGLWLTIISVTSWLSLSDAGIANSLRNSLSQALAKGELIRAKELISSSYVYFFILLSAFLLLSFTIIYFINLNFILNVSLDFELKGVVTFSICAVIVNVYFMLNSAVFYAMNKPSFDAKRTFLFQFFFVALCFTLSESYNSNDVHVLFYVSIAYFISAFFSNLIGYLYLQGSNPELKPSISDSKLPVFKGLLNVGFKFLLLQLSAVLLYSTDAFLIAHLFNISSVTNFNLTNKIFFIFIFIQGAVFSPMWSRYTYLYTQKQTGKIITQLKVSLGISFCLLVLMLLILNYISPILNFWLGKSDIMVDGLAIGVFTLTAVRLWCSNFSTLLNGVGDLQAQLIASISAIFINIPLSIIFVKWFGFGVEGVAYGSAIALLIFGVIGPFRAYKFISNLNEGTSSLSK